MAAIQPITVDATINVKPGTLAERLLAITAELQEEGVTPTGRSPFSKDKALSIGDVESAITPLLVKHGVLIRFKTRNLIHADKEWVVEVTAVVTMLANAQGDNDPGNRYALDAFSDDWADCGNSPAAAYSFARKSYLKQLFHIATTADDALSANHDAPAPQETRRPEMSVTERAAQGTIPASGQGSLCVFCQEEGYKTGRGLSPKLWIANKGPMAGSLQCDGRLPDGGWCNHPAPTTAEEDEAAADAAPFNYEAP